VGIFSPLSRIGLSFPFAFILLLPLEHHLSRLPPFVGLSLHRPMVGTGFNLVGYAFMLHLYSSRLSHSIDATADGRPSRPSSHILFSMWLAVLELEWIHLSEFSSEWGRRRLIPTGFCSLLGLVSSLLVCSCFILAVVERKTTYALPFPLSRQTHFFYNLYTKPYRLPSYSFMSTLVTSALLGIVALTATLNGLTSLFTTGTIDIQHLLPHSSSLPDMSEEFDLAIMRLGTACLESTKMTGLGNVSCLPPSSLLIGESRTDLESLEQKELNTVNFPLRSYLDVPATSSQTSSLLSAFSATSTSISVPSPSSNQNPWSNRIYNVPTPSSTSLPTTPGINCSNSPYLTHLTRLCSTLIRFSLGLGWWLLGFVPGGRAGVRLLGRIRMRYWRWGVWRVEMLEEQEGDAVVEEGSQESKDDMAMEGILEEIRRGEGEEDRQEEEDVYQLFLEGSTFDGDDSDSSFTPHSRHSSRAGSRSRSCSVSSSTSSSSSSTIQGHRSSQRSRTTFDEYDDDINLPLSLPSSPTLQTHLLAHLLQPTSSSPLTRNRYALIAPTPAQPATLSDPSISSSISSSFLSPLEATIRERRQHHPTQLGSIDEDEESERERRSACIICATAAREVVTIPCLCLTLCEARLLPFVVLHFPRGGELTGQDGFAGCRTVDRTSLRGEEERTQRFASLVGRRSQVSSPIIQPAKSIRIYQNLSLTPQLLSQVTRESLSLDHAIGTPSRSPLFVIHPRDVWNACAQCLPMLSLPQSGHPYSPGSCLDGRCVVHTPFCSHLSSLQYSLKRQQDKCNREIHRERTNTRKEGDKKERTREITEEEKRRAKIEKGEERRKRQTDRGKGERNREERL
jgi:hypothetical protein